MLVNDSDSLVNGVAIKSTYSCLPKVKKGPKDLAMRHN